MIAASVLILCLLLVAYPFAIYPAILRLLPAKPVMQSPAGAPLPSATLVFCAYNEAAALPAKLANLRAIKALHPDIELLAYDDGSSDGSGMLLAEAADILTTVTGPGRTGKAHGMKLLAARARGDILIFTDANVTLEPESVARLLHYYADMSVGGVLGSLHYQGANASASASVGGFYWRLEEALKDRESATGNVMGADGSIFSIRRTLYPEFPDDVLDDLVVSMSTVFSGHRLIKAKDVIATEMMVAERQDELRRKVRIAARAWRTHSWLRPQLRRMTALDRFKYASRKIVRWFGALWIMAGTLAALVLAWSCAPLAALGLFLAGAAGLVAGLSARKGPLAAITDIILAYFATLWGVTLAMRGRDFTTWKPAKSRR